ncbi:MAG: hypothetical protein OXI90_03360 [Gammaproteobacteria bacterium]|nr:hypothetical protein [Gammaproteobacteria bacterium]
MTARVKPTRQFADFVADAEDQSERVARFFGQIGRMEVVPEPQAALGPGEEGRFGESGSVGHDR